jgi:hypothetical protein
MSSVSRIRRLIQTGRGRGHPAEIRNDGPSVPVSGTRQPARKGRSPEYYAIIGFDIAGFGQRDEHLQNHVREALYRLLEQAFAQAGLPWPEQGLWEDRGDGALLIVPMMAAEAVLDPLLRQLNAGLRRYNKVSSDPAQITLRMAVHSGFVQRDDHGLSGEALVQLYRLLDAPAFKDAVKTAGANLGLVVSPYIYENVVRHGRGLINPDSYEKLPFVNKETSAEAWLHWPS